MVFFIILAVVVLVAVLKARRRPRKRAVEAAETFSGEPRFKPAAFPRYPR